MSKKVNPTIVGAFVIGALGLSVLAVAIFGSGALFQKRSRAVAFFHEDIQGLSVGAPVTLDGVRVGTVVDIRINVNVSQMTPLIPVYVEFDPKAINFSGLTQDMIQNQTILKGAIAKGLHARLGSQSLVTGQLLVNLSLDPGEPAQLTGADPSTVEIPTTLSEVSKLKTTLANIPVDQITGSVLRLVDNLNDVVKSPQVGELLKSLAAASDQLKDLTATVDKQLPPLLDNLGSTSTAARQTLATTDKTLGNTDRLLNSDIRETVDSAREAVQRAAKLLTDADSLVSQGSTQRYDINQVLQNLSAATRSLREFTDELERRPNAVIMGK